MVDTGPAGRQIEMEETLLTLWERGCSESTPLSELFGAYDRWLLPLPPHQLLLHPAVKEWFFLDPLHQSWERTGFGVREVTFVVERGRLGAQHRPTTAPASEAAEQWYYRVGGREKGPISRDELLRLICGGRVPARAFVRKNRTVFLRRAAWIAEGRMQATVCPGPDQTQSFAPVARSSSETLRIAAPLARLVAVEGPLAGQVFGLREALRVGRGPDARICLDDPSVSRQHAEFRRQPDGAWVVEDLGSANGTLVNGALTDGPVVLTPGDRIRVSDTTLRFEV